MQFLREEKATSFPILPQCVWVISFSLFHFWTLGTWFCLLSWMDSLPLGCDSHSGPVVLSWGGFQILVCQYFGIEFPRPTNTILGTLGGSKGEGKCRPPATNTVWGDPAKRAPFVQQICLWGPLLRLVVVVSGQQLLRDGAHPAGSYLQGHDEWHPLHSGVSAERLWYSAPAISPRWCGLL